MSGLEKTQSKFRNFSVYVICSFMLAVMGFLTVQSLLYTSYVDAKYEVTFEKLYYEKDNVFINLLTLILGTIVVYFVSKLCQKIKYKKLMILLFVWFSAVGLLWIFSSSTNVFADSSICFGIAKKFASGDYNLTKSQASYLNKFPFQLGFLAYSQLIFSIFGLFRTANFECFQIINVLLFAGTMCLIANTVRLTVNEKTAKITAVLCMTAIQPVFFCTFVYGNIPSFAFAVAAIYCMMLFIKKGNSLYAVISAVCIGISVSLKQNSYIILAAMIIIVCFDFFKNRNELIKKAAYVAMCVALSVVIVNGINAIYDAKTDINLHEGVPMASWLAMGLGESELENGWYNAEYSVILYNNNDKNSQKTSQAAVNIIKEELNGFKENPSKCASHFYYKAVSQWNEPDYQSLWMSKITKNTFFRLRLGKFLTGAGEKGVSAYMNAYQQIVYLFALIGVFFCLKRKNQLFCIFALIILGGFIYHMLFEAKAQYSLIYFVLMLPIAANGFENIFSILQQNAFPKIKSMFKKAKHKKEKVSV